MTRGSVLIAAGLVILAGYAVEKAGGLNGIVNDLKGNPSTSQAGANGQIFSISAPSSAPPTVATSVTASQIVQWASARQVPVCAVNAYVAQVGTLPGTTTDLAAWGMATAQINSAGDFACAGTPLTTAPGAIY